GYAEAERSATHGMEKLGVSVSSTQPSEGDGDANLVALQALPVALRSTVAELVAVRGLAQSLASRHAEARATLDVAVRLAHVAGEPRIRSVALGSLAFALQRDDHLGEAKTAYEEALAAAEEAGDAGSVATTRLNLATIAKAQGDLAATIRHLEAAVDMGRRSGRVSALRQALLNLANLDLYLGRLARARVSIDALAAERAELPPHQGAQLLALEAEHAQRSGAFDDADRLCLAAATAYQAMGRTVDEAEARLERVVYITSRGSVTMGETPKPPAQPAGAVDAPALGREIARAVELLGGATAHRALLLFARGRLATVEGDDAGAREAYDEA